MTNAEQNLRAKDLHHAAAEVAIAHANENEIELIKTLLTVSALVLTFTATVATSANPTLEIRHLLSVSLIFAFFSIIFGVLQFIFNIRYFANSGFKNNDAEREFLNLDSDYEENRRRANLILSELERTSLSQRIALAIQILTVGLSLFYLLRASLLIFNFNLPI